MIDKVKDLNPFNVTKAVDFSDQQIEDFWVDFAGGKGFFSMTKPTSPMPMLILGGKGSGKTHIMRYFSYELQKIRYKTKVIEGIKEEGFIGIYFRCGGLNAHRFNNKGIDENTWKSIFAYFMELWFAQLLINLILDAFNQSPELLSKEKDICKEITELFDSHDFEQPISLNEYASLLRSKQKEVSFAVNNASVTKAIKLDILVSPGQLTFGIPKILARNLISFKDIQFLYLVDEFENLDEQQQQYINTLYREKELPCSFKIGARLYGIKTYRTFSANEDNKEGSEFETLHLDDYLRNLSNYPDFARKLCAKRLKKSGYSSDNIDNFFEEIQDTKFGESFIHYFFKDYPVGEEFPHIKKLRTKLEEALKKNLEKDITSYDDINTIISNLSFRKYPFLEKVNTFLLYQDWFREENLIQSSKFISIECKNFVSQTGDYNRFTHVINHFKNDLLAQMIRDANRKQPYYGFDVFVKISDGLPRHLLMILKDIYQWAVFNGEHPFTKDQKISIDSQTKGVKEASDWFYRDARKTGEYGDCIRYSIDRLATLFREVRYSDKPSECSATALSTYIADCQEFSQRLIELAEKWSLLIRIIHGQKGKSSKKVVDKFQLNSMLAPRWDLSIGYRGSLDLNPFEVDAIFNAENHEKQINRNNDYQNFKKKRVSRMNAPLFGKPNKKSKNNLLLRKLPGLE